MKRTKAMIPSKSVEAKSTYSSDYWEGYSQREVLVGKKPSHYRGEGRRSGGGGAGGEREREREYKCEDSINRTDSFSGQCTQVSPIPAIIQHDSV